MTQTLKLSTYPRNAGKTLSVGDPFFDVLTVPYGEPADITFNRFTKDYSTRNARPYYLTGSKRQFSTLKAAVKAWKKERSIG